MSVRIAWPASPESAQVATYEVERAADIVGPWSLMATIANDLLGPNYDESTEMFFYEDPTGLSESWYRLVAVTATGLRSQPSTPFQPLVAPVPVAVGTAIFTNVNGTPKKTKLIISAVGAQSLAGQVLAGGDPLVVSTDIYGRLEVPLARGARVRVAIEGTTMVREFVVPDVAMFDIIAAMSEAPDLFTVQTTEPLVERRSF